MFACGPRCGDSPHSHRLRHSDRVCSDFQIRKWSADGSTADDYDGVIVYIKPGLYGGEPRDVFNYATANQAFPHESTADQFFSESQFESYRALGRHIVATLEEDRVKAGYTLADMLEEPWRQRFLGSFE